MPKDSDKHIFKAWKRIMIIPMNYQIIHLLVDFKKKSNQRI